MSKTKPHTLLSFVCNTTGTPAYRTEMHMDMRRAFQRFEVNNGAAEASCFEIERAAYDIRVSSADAFELVPLNGTLYADAQDRMRHAPRVLFEELTNEIVAMVLDPSAFGDLGVELDPDAQPAAGITGFGPISITANASVAVSDNGAGTNPPTVPYLLLEYVYYFFHFKDARAAIMNDTSGIERAADAIEQSFGPIPRSSNGKPEVLQTLLSLGTMMDATARSAVTEVAVRPLALALCTLLASEYSVRGHKRCW
jgi:hypothetical protein